MRKIKVLIILFLLISCDTKRSSDFESQNNYILAVILGEKPYEIGEEPINLRRNCNMEKVKIFGLDKEGSQREVSLFYDDLKNIGISVYKISSMKFKVIRISGLDILEGVSCIKSNKGLFLIAYSGLLNDNKNLYTINFSYIYDRESDGIEMGCDGFNKFLKKHIFYLKYRFHRHECKSEAK
jgi:hypothetical protein